MSFSIRPANEKALMDYAELTRKQLEKVFAPDTAVSGAVAHPKSSGHCAAVSVLVHKLIGALFVSAVVQGQSHWFNRIKINEQVYDFDLTGDQFGFAPIRIAPAGSLFEGTRERQYSQLNEETLKRASLLEHRYLTYED